MYQIRPATENDFNFIANSYLKSYRTAPETKPMINEIYFPEYKSRLNHMVRTGAILVACSQEDHDQILGYAIFGALGQYAILHYVYVKFPVRNFGIGKALALAAVPDFGNKTTVVTHLPKNWSERAIRYQLVYDPKYAKETI